MFEEVSSVLDSPEHYRLEEELILQLKKFLGKRYQVSHDLSFLNSEGIDVNTMIGLFRGLLKVRNRVSDDVIRSIICLVFRKLSEYEDVMYEAKDKEFVINDKDTVFTVVDVFMGEHFNSDFINNRSLLDVVLTESYELQESIRKLYEVAYQVSESKYHRGFKYEQVDRFEGDIVYPALFSSLSEAYFRYLRTKTLSVSEELKRHMIKNCVYLYYSVLDVVGRKEELDTLEVKYVSMVNEYLASDLNTLFSMELKHLLDTALKSDILEFLEKQFTRGDVIYRKMLLYCSEWLLLMLNGFTVEMVDSGVAERLCMESVYSDHSVRCKSLKDLKAGV